MASSADVVGLTPDSEALTPLPDVLRRGLTAVAVLACLSFCTTTLTVLFLTFKLIRWHIRTRRGGGIGTSRPPVLGLLLGLLPRRFRGHDRDAVQERKDDVKRKSPNQFLILLFNLLIADMQQSGSFLINAAWVATDTIQVGTPACFLQGWLVSNGDLAGGLFLSAIAIHTYVTVVLNRKPAQWAVYAGIVSIWVFTYFISALGIAITHNGRTGGGFYVRAGPWCWVNVRYENLRLLTHYLYIFMSLAIVSILYTLIFFHLRQRQRQLESEPPPSQPQDQPRPKSGLSLRGEDHQPDSASTASRVRNGHHPAFLLYPVIYVACTAPLALGRIATMAGAKVPLGYFCAAGALITSNGWLDVLLWGVTRRVLLFESEIDAEGAGLETFTFMRTPPERKYGNMVWVQGASRGDAEKTGREETDTDEARDGCGLRKAAQWRREASGRLSAAGNRKRGSSAGQMLGHRRPGSRGISQESLKSRGDLAIQMDVVTTVEVEVEVEVEAEKQDAVTRALPIEQQLEEGCRSPSRLKMDSDSTSIIVDMFKSRSSGIGLGSA